MNQFAIFSNYTVVPPWLEARATLLIKHMTTVEKTSDTNMVISKTWDMTIIKNLII